jgi:hypothetical protein
LKWVIAQVSPGALFIGRRSERATAVRDASPDLACGATISFAELDLLLQARFSGPPAFVAVALEQALWLAAAALKRAP